VQMPRSTPHLRERTRSGGGGLSSGMHTAQKVTGEPGKRKKTACQLEDIGLPKSWAPAMNCSWGPARCLVPPVSRLGSYPPCWYNVLSCTCKQSHCTFRLSHDMERHMFHSGLRKIVDSCPQQPSKPGLAGLHVKATGCPDGTCCGPQNRQLVQNHSLHRALGALSNNQVHSQTVNILK